MLILKLVLVETILNYVFQVAVHVKDVMCLSHTECSPIFSDSLDESNWLDLCLTSNKIDIAYEASSAHFQS